MKTMGGWTATRGLAGALVQAGLLPAVLVMVGLTCACSDQGGVGEPAPGVRQSPLLLEDPLRRIFLTGSATLRGNGAATNVPIDEVLELNLDEREGTFSLGLGAVAPALSGSVQVDFELDDNNLDVSYELRGAVTYEDGAGETVSVGFAGPGTLPRDGSSVSDGGTTDSLGSAPAEVRLSATMRNTAAGPSCPGDAPTGDDSDGDGLFDIWETDGIDTDCDGNVDVDLPNMGADPNHKDLYVELDWWSAQDAPTQSAIRQMQLAFAAAPVDVGGIPNPDGRPGVHLWVDTGTLLDPTGIEGGGSCLDGVDNDGDSLVDEADPDCVSGFGIEGVGGCSDGIDNDNNGVADAMDPSCALSPGGASIEGAGLCNDGVDNDSDGTVDLADTDCLVGNSFPGFTNVGQLIAPAAAGVSGFTEFYLQKPSNFDPKRRLVFRYGILAPKTDPRCAGMAGCRTYKGGTGEIGGNDFIERNHDPGTIMHELGHTLNLRHGGNNNRNCKANYVSVMNYHYQKKIPRNAVPGVSPSRSMGQDLDGDGRIENAILDYSPPRFPGGRGIAPIASLVETALAEAFIPDATDGINQLIFVDGTGTTQRWALNGQDFTGDGAIDGVDWDGDGALTPGTVAVDVDTGDATTGKPSACADENTGISDVIMRGNDDWTRVSLPFRHFGDSADGAINPDPELDQDLTELTEIEDSLNTADVRVRLKRDHHSRSHFGAAKRRRTIEVIIDNRGPMQSDDIVASIQLPRGAVHLSDSVGCQVQGQRTLSCDVGSLAPGDSFAFTVIFAQRPVWSARCQVRAEVEHLAGPDPNLRNNHANLRLACPVLRRPPHHPPLFPGHPWTPHL